MQIKINEGIKLNDAVRIVNTNWSEIENQTGIIAGLSSNGLVKIWIVLLDAPMSDGTLAVTVPESCLEKVSPKVPSIPKYTMTPWIPFDTTSPTLPNEPIGQCTKCGRSIFTVDMYYCSDTQCPTQTKVVC